MLIDWFTVGAQALNFVILVGLMRRFLYKPILRSIDARERRIAGELQDAGARKAEAARERDDLQHKNDEIDQQRAALLKKATDEASAERERLLGEARSAAEALGEERAEKLRSDADALRRTFRLRAQREVFAIAKKALADLATTSLEERLGEVFTRRLREMDGTAKQSFGEALAATSGPVVVRSAFDLPAAQRAIIQNAVNETFSADIHLRFETAPELVSGIELTAEGQRVAWSIRDYLTSLEKEVGELVKDRADREAPHETAREAKTAPEGEADAPCA